MLKILLKSLTSEAQNHLRTHIDSDIVKEADAAVLMSHVELAELTLNMERIREKFCTHKSRTAQELLNEVKTCISLNVKQEITVLGILLHYFKSVYMC